MRGYDNLLKALVSRVKVSRRAAMRSMLDQLSQR
jgi:hypothetical protein